MWLHIANRERFVRVETISYFSPLLRIGGSQEGQLAGQGVDPLPLRHIAQEFNVVNIGLNLLPS